MKMFERHETISSKLMLPVNNTTALSVFFILFAVVGLGIFQYVSSQEQRIAYLETKLAQQSSGLDALSLSTASSSTAIAESIQILEKNLNLTKEESLRLASNLSSTLSAEQQKVASVLKNLDKVNSSVGTLEKLSETDKELLAKYSKVFFLNENYVPSKLGEIKNKYLYSEQKTRYFHASALPFLTRMLDDAQSSGVQIYVASAYRSFNEQDNIKQSNVVTYGAGTANQFSADQGYSEHQLGTTIDLITTGMNGKLSVEFKNTNAYVWLTQNAHRYGFVLSYPEGNNFYIFEPWHWRFVGTALATKLKSENRQFYDLDQREIDKYLVSLFDQK